jgi:PKD repeat protein
VGLRSLVPAVVSVWLALGAADAHAGHFDFTVTPDPPNEGQVTTFALQGPTDDVERIRWDLDGDGDFDDAEEDKFTVTHVYGAPGPVAVRMRVDEEDEREDVLRRLTVNGAPSVDFSFLPANPLTGEDVSFASTVSDPEGDDVALAWSFDDGATSTEASPTHSYAAGGTYTVTLTATDAHGATAFAGKTVPVDEAPRPTAGFTYSPASPFTGELVTFTSTSTPGQGAITKLEWDLDDDGEFDDGTGPEARWSYASAGSHLVLLRATQTDGKRSVAFEDVDVAQRPPARPPPTDTSSPAITDPVIDPIIPPRPRPLVRMRPFPVVRIAGVVLPDGADVRVLSVRAPRGARVRVRCRGRGCPVRSLTRATAARLVRLRRFERRLRAGIRLELFVRQTGRIGKYTRFVIRAGEPPARVDRCLIPGRARPVRCT